MKAEHCSKMNLLFSRTALKYIYLCKLNLNTKAVKKLLIFLCSAQVFNRLYQSIEKVIAHGWRKKTSLMNTKGSRSRPLRLASTSVSQYTYWFARAAKLKSYYYCIIGHESKLITYQQAIHIMRSFFKFVDHLTFCCPERG